MKFILIPFLLLSYNVNAQIKMRENKGQARENPAGTNYAWSAGQRPSLGICVIG